MMDLTNSRAFTRRAFLVRGLTLASTAGTIPFFLNNSARVLAGPMDTVPGARPGVPDDRILVVVQLAGGNDGLNTVIPYGDAAYYRARPAIGIPEKDVLKLGTSGRAILEALARGESDLEHLADLASRRLTATRAQLVEALQGRVTDHHRFILRLHLTQIRTLDAAVAEVEARIREALTPFRAAVSLLMTMPGVSETAAAVILGEVGDDMSKFPSAGHLLSWAGLCPRLDESNGRRRSTRTRQGAPWLKTTLVQIAWAAARKKNSYFHAQFLRLKSRRGPKKAIVAVAASMLTDVYYLLRDGVEFHDLGDQYFVHRDKTRLAKRLLQRLRDLGVEVEVKPAA